MASEITISQTVRTSGRPECTPEQSAAIAARDFSVALSAGAGCGKTFVLTERFLSHLEPAKDRREKPTRLSQLVAITFTERAAREMRDRDPQGVLQAAQELPGGRGRALAGVAPRVGFRADQHDPLVLRFALAFARRRSRAGPAFPRARRGPVRHAAVRTDRSRAAAAIGRPRRNSHRIGREIRPRSPAGDGRAVPRPAAEYRLAGVARQNAGGVDRALGKVFSARPSFRKCCGKSPIRPTAARCWNLRGRSRAHAVMRSCKSGWRPFSIRWRKFRPANSGRNPAAVLSRISEILREAARVQGGGTKKNWSHEELYNQFRDAAAELRKTDRRLQEKRLLRCRGRLPVAEMGVRLLHLSEEVAAEYEREKQSLGRVGFRRPLDPRPAAAWSGRSDNRSAAAGPSSCGCCWSMNSRTPIRCKSSWSRRSATTRSRAASCFSWAISSSRSIASAAPIRTSSASCARRFPTAAACRSRRISAASRAIIDFVNALFSEEFGEGYEPLRRIARKPAPRPRSNFSGRWKKTPKCSPLRMPERGRG